MYAYLAWTWPGRDIPSRLWECTWESSPNTRPHCHNRLRERWLRCASQSCCCNKVAGCLTAPSAIKERWAVNGTWPLYQLSLSENYWLILHTQKPIKDQSIPKHSYWNSKKPSLAVSAAWLHRPVLFSQTSLVRPKTRACRCSFMHQIVRDMTGTSIQKCWLQQPSCFDR